MKHGKILFILTALMILQVFTGTLFATPPPPPPPPLAIPIDFGASILLLIGGALGAKKIYDKKKKDTK